MISVGAWLIIDAVLDDLIAVTVRALDIQLTRDERAFVLSQLDHASAVSAGLSRAAAR